MSESTPLHARLKLLQYQSQLQSILADSDSLDSQILKDTTELISEMRDQILLRIHQVVGRSKTGGGIEPEWGQYWISKLAAEFNQVIVGISEKFNTNLTGYAIKAYEVGRNFADKGLEFAAPQLDLKNPDTEKLLPKLNALGVRLASNVPGDLITGMQEKQLAAIVKECSISMSLGEPPTTLMQRLSVNVDKGVWRTSFARAEVIARTECARVLEIGRQKRAEQIQRTFPEVSMYYQWLAAPIREWPCKRCDAYDGNVYDADGGLFILAPGKMDGKRPDLPLHPNCFHPSTLVECESGFKPILDIEIDELVWSLDPLEYEISLKPVTGKIVYKFSGNLVHFKNFDILATEDHRMLVKNDGFGIKQKFAKKVKPTDTFLKCLQNQKRTIFPEKVGPIKSVPYEGLVGCIEVAGNETILIRSKENEPFWTFQCRCTLVPYVPGLSPDPATQAERAEQYRKEEVVKKAQAHLSKLSWDDLLKIWILDLPDNSKRTINMPKSTPEENLQRLALALVRSAGFSDVNNVVLIEHPREMVGSAEERNRTGKRLINRMLGVPSRFKNKK